MEKKGGELVRGFFPEGALTASGDHWDLLPCFALYLHNRPTVMSSWRGGRGEGMARLRGSYDHVLSSRLWGPPRPNVAHGAS